MNRTLTISALSLAILIPFQVQAQNQNQELIAPGAEVEEVATGFAFTEGPAADEQGNLYFTDIRNNRIHKWSTDGELSTFREDSNATNGLFFDSDWQLFGAEGGTGRIVKMDEEGTAEVVVDEYEGSPFNSPNDLWIDAEGGIYFTDPRYGDESDLPQDGYHVYYLAPGAEEARRIIDDMERPNGIIGTKDGETLYVADHGANVTYAFTIEEPGQLSEGREFAPQGSDGVTLDEEGNLYLTNSEVSIYSPEGELLEQIETPQAPANVAFAGPDRRTLYITARTGLYAIEMNISGMY